METEVNPKWGSVLPGADAANEITTDDSDETVCMKTKNGLTHILNRDAAVQYVMGDLLGKGGFAKVYKLTTTAADLTTVAAGKIIPKSSITKAHHKEKVSREIDIHKRMKHKSVVQFYNYFEDMENVFIILEYCGTKTLSSVLKARKHFLEPEIRYYLRQIISGCQHIHAQGVVHRDLKLSNLFLTDNMKLKIGDFGLSAYINSAMEKKETICGTPNYISPEVITKSGHSYPVDIWAIGCIVFAMLVGRPPFETSSLKDTYRKIARSQYNEPREASGYARNLIAKCLQVNPSHRPKLDQLSTHSFLTNGFTPSQLSPKSMTSPPDFTSNSASQSNKLPPASGASAANVREKLDDLSFSELVKLIISEVVKENICAEGGKDHRIGHADKCCRELLDAIREIIENIKDKECKTNPASVNGEKCTWISKWVDYSHKYGFGFQLSNHISGANFRDGLSIAVNKSSSRVGLRTPQGVVLDCNSDKLPHEYAKKLQLIEYFVKYMNETLICGGDLEHEGDRLTLSDIFLYHWLRTSQAIAMCLSTGTIQVNFVKDHTKIIVSKIEDGSYQLMYINQRRIASVFNLADIKENGCSQEVKDRLEYAAFQLDVMLTRTAGSEDLSVTNMKQG